jgi:predicted nuclease of predicted toxin-antitoxin system
MPLSPGLAAWLVDRGHDAMHAADLGLARETDAVIMARAKQRDDGITVDLDYPRLLALAEATEPSASSCFARAIGATPPSSQGWPTFLQQ